MSRILALLGVACLLAQPGAAIPQQPAPTGGYPAWAFPLKVEKPFPAEGAVSKSLPGSTRTYTQAQIDDLPNPPDWFPDRHAEPPPIVVSGHGDALACGACHLMSGLGHPESSDLTGLSVNYLVAQMADFAAGTRIDVPRMNRIARAVSEAQVREAAGWFARLPRRPFTRTVETDTVPKTFLGDGRMRFVDPDGGNEPIGSRIVTVPEDAARARLRDPDSGFIAYVPAGSIARGKVLAEAGGPLAMPCATCHGPDLRGAGDVPRLAGMHPIYLVRQLYRFRDGSRDGPNAGTMRTAAEGMSDEDIVNLSAYLGSLVP